MGGVGSMAAYYLARAGHEVVGLEQFRIDHDRGESFGGSRVIRRVYPDVLYTRLMDDAYRLWDAVQAEAGEELLVRCGGLHFGPAEHREMVNTERSLTEAGVPFERWDAAETMRRYPQIRLDRDEVAIFQAETGFLRASRCVRAGVRLAKRHGAEVREAAAVAAIDSRPDGVRVALGDGGSLTVDRVVVSAGPWTSRFLPWLAERFVGARPVGYPDGGCWGPGDRPLVVTRQQYIHLQPAPGDTRFRLGSFPVWIDNPVFYYGFPEHDEIPGVKIALHQIGDLVNPDAVNRSVDDACRADLRAYARRRFPDLTDTITYEKTCLYDNTPDEDFIVDRLPDEPRVVLVGGTSGHGFKFTVLLGQIAAALATDGAVRHDLSRFALRRLVSRS
jgi:glycine/D-amino acid oxidase-like deaminating enzyme